MSQLALQIAFERAQAKIKVLEGMIEEKTRELFLEKEDLEDVKNYLDGILNTMLEAVMVIDRRRRIKYANTTALNLLGFSRSEIEDRPVEDIFRFDSLFETNGESVEFVNGSLRTETVFTGKSGKKIPVLVSSSVMRNLENSTQEIVCVAHDISERKTLETQLLQSEKLESIGRLAAGIAHEINTPIQYVGDNNRFLGDAFKDLTPFFDKVQQVISSSAGPTANSELMTELALLYQQADVPYLRDEVPKAISQSLEGVERVAKIVRAMKEFSHPGTESKQAMDINRLLQSTITISTNEWKYVATIETDFDPSLGTVPLLPGDFNQVSLNLLVNAAHAIEDCVKKGKYQRGLIKVSTKKLNDWVEVKIQDNGAGIPEDIKSKIFDPFFTTKQMGRGTGQGLTIARSVIVDKHRGKIEFVSLAGQGTTFSIKLPLT